jgi:DNA-binding response OmpR family regulator
LLDLLMPNLTGFELCKTFSSLSLTRDTPILIFSGNPAMDYQEFCAHLGARDYFQKPLDFERLRNRIDQLVTERLQEPRREASVKLKVGIELRGLDQYGKSFRVATSTEVVSANGFRCACDTSLLLKSQVEVYLTSGESRRRLGRAQVVHALQRVANRPEYGFHFVQRPAEWLL